MELNTQIAEYKTDGSLRGEETLKKELYTSSLTSSPPLTLTHMHTDIFTHINIPFPVQQS